MSRNSPKRQRPPVNPEMLAWARKWRGRTLEEAARRVQKTPEDIEAWESKPGGPTVRQARQLADLYERSFLEFFRDAPPDLVESELVPDYRIQRGVKSDPTEIRELKAIQDWAEEKRTNAIDLFEELGEEPPAIPDELFAQVDRGVELAAENARRVLGFDIAEQFALKKADRELLPNIIRRKFENSGILTLRRSDLSHFGARGICIVIFPLPIIVYGNKSPGAQAFTLSHELGHIIRQQSAISGPRRRDPPIDIERWCDQFAAAFLMPRKAIQTEYGILSNQPAPDIADPVLEMLASQFRVSPHAMLIRLANLGYVDAAYYWGVKKPQFDEMEDEYKSKFHGRPKYYGRRYESSVGDLYTGLVLEAWNSGHITNHNAAEYMDIRNFEHLYDIRDNFKRS